MDDFRPFVITGFLFPFFLPWSFLSYLFEKYQSLVGKILASGKHCFGHLSSWADVSTPDICCVSTVSRPGLNLETGVNEQFLRMAMETNLPEYPPFSVVQTNGVFS